MLEYKLGIIYTIIVIQVDDVTSYTLLGGSYICLGRIVF